MRLGAFVNRLLLVWGAGAMAFAVAVVETPWLRTAFRTTPLTRSDWLLSAGLALAGALCLEVWKGAAPGRRRGKGVATPWRPPL